MGKKLKEACKLQKSGDVFVLSIIVSVDCWGCEIVFLYQLRIKDRNAKDRSVSDRQQMSSETAYRPHTQRQR